MYTLLWSVIDYQQHQVNHVDGKAWTVCAYWASNILVGGNWKLEHTDPLGNWISNFFPALFITFVLSVLLFFLHLEWFRSSAGQAAAWS